MPRLKPRGRGQSLMQGEHQLIHAPSQVATLQLLLVREQGWLGWKGGLARQAVHIQSVRGLKSSALSNPHDAILSIQECRAVKKNLPFPEMNGKEYFS